MKICVGDLEANNLLPLVTKAHCGVFKDIKTGEVTKFRPNQMEQMLEFMDTIDVLIFHNGIGYDWPLLKKLFNYTYKGKKVDTLIMSRLLNPKRIVPYNCPNKRCGPHSIEAWGWRVGRGKPEHNDWENFSEDMLHRCSEDVEILHLVYQELLSEAKGDNWRDAFLLSFKLFENLQKQEEYGWLVDQEWMKTSCWLLKNHINRIDRIVTPHLPMILEVNETKEGGEYKYVKKPFVKSGEYAKATNDFCVSSGWNPGERPILGPYSRISFRPTDLNSNAETKEFLLGLGWEPVEWNTNDDGERTSPKLSKDDPFEGIERGIGKLVARRVQCRHRLSSITGLFELIRPDGAIPSVVNSLASTGRATHRNIVNIPAAKSYFGKQMRKIFVSRPGMVLVGCDSDSNQIRQLAARMNDDQYTNSILSGKKSDGSDMHSVNMRAAGLPDRDAAKTFFYGFLFGAGDAKIGKIVKGNAARGRQLKEDFLKGLPALGVLIEKLQTEWRATARQRYNAKFRRMEHFDGKITGLDGRPILVPSEHQVLVYLLQSDEAIHMAAAYNRCHKMLDKAGYVYGKDYGFVVWMHDEYEIECREDIAKEVAAIAEESIAWAGRFYGIKCPHLGDAKIGYDWYSIH